VNDGRVTLPKSVPLDPKNPAEKIKSRGNARKHQRKLNRVAQKTKMKPRGFFFCWVFGGLWVPERNGGGGFQGSAPMKRDMAEGRKYYGKNQIPDHDQQNLGGGGAKNVGSPSGVQRKHRGKKEGGPRGEAKRKHFGNRGIYYLDGAKNKVTSDGGRGK